ncbi:MULTISPECIES: DUF4365 domain-containing protein [Streptomyces]|uniref:DUF4365 domain-containing protein n=1 Tax=Streptomyces venezuelae (strain ATCC 10712 / CBS 650.69 / DSM 40230 / JCM 4526 / NBRC 13096 / PD 04745) TaxID=953739 RepID=F2R9H4_STRVP|nr:DUF4365 domain-containing protein [Streptomyces venezuelae]APE24554.1 hypothetical protein vnz_28345 [Streptomyces venezuelae]QES01911.1 DUF4365 domain-containing protein [Streptomyces venezuelae ATCC 10712]CCA59017.1 hypothetical protein SVEN_5731 [Streptomyces venezuelae ATCC 10712]
MEHNNHQGWYGETFVAAIAAAAGFQVAVPYPDIGKDMILGRDHEDPELDVQIALQVKTRRIGDLDPAGGLKITLTIDQFKRLRGRRQVPCYLVVVLVPQDPAAYVRVSGFELVLWHSAYWVSLEDRPLPIQQGQKSVTVTVPRENLLTVDAHEFFHRACEEVPAP